MNDDWHVAGLTVGQVSERMDIATSAVRWYADQGLLPCERVAGNQRRFFADVLCRVAMIHASQKVGLTLAEIRAALDELRPQEPPTEQEWERLATQLRSVSNERIDVLFAVLNEMTPSSAFRPARENPVDHLGSYTSTT